MNKEIAETKSHTSVGTNCLPTRQIIGPSILHGEATVSMVTRLVPETICGSTCIIQSTGLEPCSNRQVHMDLASVGWFYIHCHCIDCEMLTVPCGLEIGHCAEYFCWKIST